MCAQKHTAASVCPQVAGYSDLYVVDDRERSVDEARFRHKSPATADPLRHCPARLLSSPPSINHTSAPLSSLAHDLSFPPRPVGSSPSSQIIRAPLPPLPREPALSAQWLARTEPAPLAPLTSQSRRPQLLFVSWWLTLHAARSLPFCLVLSGYRRREHSRRARPRQQAGAGGARRVWEGSRRRRRLGAVNSARPASLISLGSIVSSLSPSAPYLSPPRASCALSPWWATRCLKSFSCISARRVLFPSVPPSLPKSTRNASSPSIARVCD